MMTIESITFYRNTFLRAIYLVAESAWRRGPRVKLLVLAGSLLLLAPWAILAQEPLALSASAQAQIAALMQEKASRNSAQRKIGSNLLLESKRALNQPLPSGMPALRRSVEITSSGKAKIEINARVTPALLRRIEALGGIVIGSYPRYGVIEAEMPVAQLQELAAETDVASIGEAIPPQLNKINTSEGDITHAANITRAALGVNGSGVKVGVLSDSASTSTLASLKASGDLPDVTVVAASTGTDEGAAMLEIVHDLAPGAQLYFATANGGGAAFATNIQALAAAGCRVIIDDMQYAEPVFQDGIIAQAVDTVNAAGVAYFSAAGNSGNLYRHTAGVWEGDFSPIAAPPVIGGTAHNFGGGLNYDTITVDSPSYFILQWADPTGGSANDYDLYLLDPTLTTVLAASTDSQTGSQDPFELIDSINSNDVGCKLVIIKKTGADRCLSLNTNRGQLSIATAGQTWGHSCAAGAFGVAAVDVHQAPEPLGGLFRGTEGYEMFTSDGPRRVFYNSAGTPYTPGNFTSTGGQLRQKPDITAADGVSCATPGFARFYGTSAAAPHAGAIAALLLSRNPLLTPAMIRQSLVSTALGDVGPTRGFDYDTGAGIVMANYALNTLSTVARSASPQGNLDLLDTNVTEAAKMSVLKFKITDRGADRLPTKIDRLTIQTSGTAGHAGQDIAWAELRNGTSRIALAGSITDSQIVFGSAPDSDGLAGLVSIPDNTSTDYTVYIYLGSPLAAALGSTYIFCINETNIDLDGGGTTSFMAGNTGTIAPVTGTLIHPKGTLGIKVMPEAAGWSLSGPLALSDTGTTTILHAPIGTYTLAWQSLAGWTPPAPNPTSVTLAMDQVTTFTGVYTRQTGTVFVSVTPNTAGWSFTDGDGAVHSGTGNAAINAVPTGTITLTWSALAGYDPPNPISQSQSLVQGGTATFTGNYIRQTGTLGVKVTPPQTGWSLSGPLALSDTGTKTILNAPTGAYTLTWQPLAGWTPPTPNPAGLSLTKDQVTSFTGVYTRQKGTVVVNVTPINASWSFTDGDGVVHGGSGNATVNNVPTGSITLTWGALVNYDAPSPNPATRSLAGGGTVTFTGSYIRQSGTIGIKVTPGQAGWSLSGPLALSDTGTTTILNAPTGAYYSLTWQPLPGWSAPTPNPAGLTLAKNQVTTFTGNYIRQTGSLLVAITPAAAAAAGGQWRRVGTSTWLAGGATENGIPTGPYQLEFNAVAGWTAPAPQDLMINKDQQTAASGAYLRQTGTVIIEVTPNNAPWTLTDGDGKLHAATGSRRFMGLPTGQVTVTWNPMTGYDAPVPNSAVKTLEGDGTIQFTEIYLSSTDATARLNARILRYLLGLISDTTGLNVNGDAFIDIADLLKNIAPH